jgi:membrane-bound metal-dependent hydrolase YbcI (DUF457 family)
MALCFTHAAAGYLVYEAMRPAGPHRPVMLLTAVALGNAPDLDFLPGLAVGRPDAFHRGVTHTLGAVLAVGLAAWALARWRGSSESPGWWAAFAALAFGSHLVVDACTVDAVPPEGARFLWPLSNAVWHAPFSVFREIVIDRSSRVGFFSSLLARDTLVVWIGEIGALLLAVAGVHALRAGLGQLRVREPAGSGSD